MIYILCSHIVVAQCYCVVNCVVHVVIKSEMHYYRLITYLLKGMCLCLFQERPGDEIWTNLDKMITPLLLNYCQCMLLQGQYYEVIEYCSSLLFKYEGKHSVQMTRSEHPLTNIDSEN